MPALGNLADSSERGYRTFDLRIPSLARRIERLLQHDERLRVLSRDEFPRLGASTGIRRLGAATCPPTSRPLPTRPTG